jgi:acetyltransferase-like isoleucine patch superfamily enzyme
LPGADRSEKEKMLAGEPFRTYEESLHAERQRCKGLLYRFNNTANPDVTLEASSIGRHLYTILAPQNQNRPRTNPDMPVGRWVQLDPPFYCDYGTNISINDRVAIGTNCKFLDSGKITIGRNCTIEANVTINTLEPPKDHKSIKGTFGLYTAKDVRIGENVFIGANSLICAGVRIGSGAIIEPGSVVKRVCKRN